MSAELYAIIAFAVGLPALIIGWIWSVVVGKKAGTKWLVANLFFFPIFAFALIYWQAAKKPFWLVFIGFLLLISTLFLVPEA